MPIMNATGRSSERYEIGIDIGGTFTDVVCRGIDGSSRLVKIPTTRGNPSAGVHHALEYMKSEWNVRPEQIVRFVHGTTVATNAVLERKGAKLGLIATEGFKDVIEIGRQNRRSMYELALTPQTPVFLIPGALRKEVRERVCANGDVLIQLDEEAVRQAVRELASEGVQAIAISFLFSFLNPIHELRAREIVNEVAPNIMTSVSFEVDPAFREYERTCVTAFDGYLKPVVDRYLENMENDLTRSGVRAPLQIMQSRGGIASSRVARRRPVRLFLSGPAAGVIGGRMVGLAAGIEDVITVDIGGTSSDIALISRGKPMIAPEGIIDSFKVRVPMVDVNAIGAGGGSIAWVDSAGSLRVGPVSAGSEPGPACYGRGGERPTVTDASIVLGYINPDYFAGGMLKLQPELARQSIAKHIATPLGMSVEQAALGIHRVVNVSMVEGIRLISVGRGIDPRQFSLLPLGGGGPLHANALARELGMRRIIIPHRPGVLSATGLLEAPVEHEVSAAFSRPLENAILAEMRSAFDDLDKQCIKLMAAENIAGGGSTVAHFADVCYMGQSYHLEIPVAMDTPDPIAKLRADFHLAHDRVYGHSTKAPAKIVNLRTIHQASVAMEYAAADYKPSEANARKADRKIMIGTGSGYIDAKVFERAALPVGSIIRGPAIIEQTDTTIVVEPGWEAEVSRDGTLAISTLQSAKDEEDNTLGVTGASGARLKLDPITVEVVRNKLEGIANEMEMTLLRSSFSPIVKEGLDASASLFKLDGTTLAQACSVPIHLATLIPAVSNILARYPVETMQENDTYIVNDPYCGGTHLPDIAIVSPVFHCGRAIALSAAMSHHGDVGGMTPGSMPTNATEIFQEGVRIPPLKLREAGTYNDTLVRLLRQNVRMPDDFMGDINAQIAACNVGARRLVEVADTYGADHLAAIFEDLLNRSEIMTRKALMSIPAGTYRNVEYLDNDGVELDKPIRIEVAVTVKDGNIEFDFEGTSPQVKGPLNCVKSGSLAAACFAVRALTDSTIPTNGGCFRPLALRLPQGSIVNPVEPAAVGGRTPTIKRIAGCMTAALAEVLSQKVPATSAGVLTMMAFGGQRDLRRFVVAELVAGGSGASIDRDGVDVIETDATNCMNLPAEAMEMEAPIRVHRVALRRDSGGPGKFRGGLGVVREYEILEGELSFSHRGERHFNAASGFAGGDSGAAARSVIRRADGTLEVIASKIHTTLRKGDHITVETAGGGGYGDPATRERERVCADMSNGKVSPAVARQIYRYGEATEVTGPIKTAEAAKA